VLFWLVGMSLTGYSERLNDDRGIYDILANLPWVPSARSYGIEIQMVWPAFAAEKDPRYLHVYAID
jgi:hypothetical protein